MRAAEVMTRRVVTVRDDVPLADAMRLMLEQRISGLPVVNAAGEVVGVLSEGDILRRTETGTERKRPRWLEVVLGPGELAGEYVHSHGRMVRDAMSAKVIAVAPETPLEDVVELMEKKRIKRVPVLQQGRLVGIISRANLVQTLLTFAAALPAGAASDEEIRDRLWSMLEKEHWTMLGLVNLYVHNGVVHLVGAVTDPRQRDALRVAAANTPGVRAVHDNLVWCDYLSGAVVELSEDTGAGISEGRR